MTLLERIQNTERHIMAVAGETVDLGDYRVLCAPHMASWYQANMVEIRKPGVRSLADWETVFRKHFDPAIFKHITLYLSNPDDCASLIDEIKATAAAEEQTTRPDRLDVQHIIYRLASSTAACVPLPAGLVVRPVETDQDREDLLQFNDAETKGELWYSTPEKMRPYIELRQRVADEAGVQWLRLMRDDPEDRTILSRLGVFRCDNLYRLQAVGTASEFRSKGYASALLSCAMRFAIDEQCSVGLALSVDAGTPAERLYGSLGFETVGDEYWVMRYPRDD